MLFEMGEWIIVNIDNQLFLVIVGWFIVLCVIVIDNSFVVIVVLFVI